MNPSLVPDLAHLAVLIDTVAVALLTIGIGVWVGARRAETALIAGWGVAGAATVAVGTLTQIGLSFVMIALAVIGAAGLARIGLSVRRGTAVLQAGMMGRVTLLAVPLIACSAGMATIGWDDFSHWVPNLVYLCLQNHFPTLAQPNVSEHAGYPYGLALPGFAIDLMRGQVPESAALMWNVVALLCASASIATVIGGRLHTVFPNRTGSASLPWSAAAIGLLLAGLASPTFVPKIVFSNMADSATGSILPVLLALLAEWIGASPNQRNRNGLVLTFAFGCVALINLRQANGALFGLMLIGGAVAAWRQRQRILVPAFQALSIVLLLALGVALLWGHYNAAQIPGGEFKIMPVAEWQWALLPHIAVSIGRVVLSKPGLFLVIFYLGIRAVVAMRATDTLTPPARAAVIVAAFVSFGMMGFLSFTYLAANFTTPEAAAAASFWRYMSEVGSLAVLGTVAVLPLDWLRRLPSRPAVVALLAVTVLLPFAMLRMYRADLSSPVPQLRRSMLAVDAAVPRSAPLTLMDISGNGFPVVVAFYQLVISPHAQDQAPRVVITEASPRGLSTPQLAARHFENGDYIWLADGGPEAAGFFGAPLEDGHRYLLKRTSGHFVVVASWPIPGATRRSG